MSSFTLALSLLNILPAFQLDGEYALGNFMTLLIANNWYDDQSISTSGLNIRQRAKRIEAFIVRAISVVVGLVIVGSILVGILNAAN
jgi:S2P endopeptidase